MLCKKTYKNQITLPKKLLEKFKDAEYFDAQADNEKIILRPVKISAVEYTSISSVRDKIASLGLTEKDIEKAVRYARRKKSK